MIAVRDAFPAEAKAAADRAICARLFALPEWQAAHTVFLYVSFRSEVDTHVLLAAALESGRRVLVPRVVRPVREIEACEVHSLQDLAPGTWGILEPAHPRRVAHPQEVDLVVVPGLAFDAQGGRIGYGGGFYDRYLKRVRPDCVRVGLAYEVQLVPKVPCGPKDARVHLVVTEARVIRVPQGAHRRHQE